MQIQFGAMIPIKQIKFEEDVINNPPDIAYTAQKITRQFSILDMYHEAKQRQNCINGLKLMDPSFDETQDVLAIQKYDYSKKNQNSEDSPVYLLTGLELKQAKRKINEFMEAQKTTFWEKLKTNLLPPTDEDYSTSKFEIRKLYSSIVDTLLSNPETQKTVPIEVDDKTLKFTPLS
jgi:hypothetical protein